MTADLTALGHDALAADGRIIRIRSTVPSDEPALCALHEEVGERSRYLRFFNAGTSQIGREVTRLIRPPGPNHQAVVAVDGQGLVGVASFERLANEAEAEFAILVADLEHGRGIGTLLLEELIGRARAASIRTLVGTVLPENGPMLRVSRDLAPGTASTCESGTVLVRLPTTADDAALAGVDLRERTAERHALHPLLAPASVAVVGAGRRRGGVGHEVLRSLLEHGFSGPVYPINTRGDDVAGHVAYPTLAAVGRPIDLAVIAVPAHSVEAVLSEAAAVGVRAAVILTANFGEAGPTGAAAQASLVRTARAHGIRLVGPNCLGVLNTDPAVRLVATFATAVPPPGGLAVASQSGAVGIALLDHATRTGIGISSFVSLGNKADVSGNDLLAYWYDDPATRAVALYLESFGNPRKFARVARALGRRKPVLAVKSGRSVSGQRAGVSHTAAAATPETAVETLFAQAGVVRADTLGELLDAARVLVDLPLPEGNRLGIVGNAGGVNVLAADAAEAAGLAVPDAAAGNPIDLGAAATPAALAEAITQLAHSGEVDAILAVFAATRANDTSGILDAIASAADASEQLPVLAVLIGVTNPPAHLGARRTPVFALPELAVGALGHAVRYAAWRRQPLGRRPDLAGIDPKRARAIVDHALAAGVGWQPSAVTEDLLRCYGIPLAATVVARSAAAGSAAAADLGYPVVMKAADPAIVHKSDRGLVRLDLADADALQEAYLALTTELGDPAAPVLVQAMRSRGVELVIGVVHDALFGSLVMLGLGGLFTDLLGDRTFRLLPVTDLDAGRMWRSLHGAPLLTGYRGAAPVDVSALEDVLLRVGRMAEDLPEIAELDLNPVIASACGVVTVDAKLRLTQIGSEPDATLRALREPA
ncbi:MAG: GNAT family N-acetyltransferase [Pseudonocardiales bacterium]